MVNQAMRAARGDVRGREIEPPIRRRRGQSRRNLHGKRALFTQRRRLYRGTTRSRDTQVMPGHPLGGFWDRWMDAARSSKPRVRQLAHRQMARTYPIFDEIAGTQ
jgi:hypothetical protein